MSTAVRRPPKRYTPAQIDQGLTALILTGGNADQALELLDDWPRRPSPTSLRNWQRDHKKRHAELEQELAPKLAEIAAADAERLALKMAQVEDQLVDHIAGRLHELDPDKASAALRNISTSKALQYDKISSPLRGRPTVNVMHHDSNDLLRQLARGAGLRLGSTESTAEEISGEQRAIASQ